MPSELNRRPTVALSSTADHVVPVRTADMLTVRTAHQGSTFLITLTGDLDLSNAAKLDRVLREAAASGATETVVDLTRLRFIDSTGLQLLITADRNVHETGRQFVLLRGSDMVERVFDICGLDDVFTFAD